MATEKFFSNFSMLEQTRAERPLLNKALNSTNGFIFLMEMAHPCLEFSAYPSAWIEQDLVEKRGECWLSAIEATEWLHCSNFGPL